jgi:hypothetical protein
MSTMQSRRYQQPIRSEILASQIARHRRSRLALHRTIDGLLKVNLQQKGSTLCDKLKNSIPLFK